MKSISVHLVFGTKSYGKNGDNDSLKYVDLELLESYIIYEFSDL